MKYLLLVLFLCACAPSPETCRYMGVNVDNDDVVTGILNERHPGTQEDIRKACRVPFDPKKQGCTVVVGITEDNRGIYDAWYTGENALLHEECHIYYEEWRHIINLENLGETK